MEVVTKELLLVEERRSLTKKKIKEQTGVAPAVRPRDEENWWERDDAAEVGV